MSNYRWDLRPLPADYTPDLAKKVGRYAAKVLALRGLASQVEGFLDPSAYQPSSPFDFPDMDVAVQRLLQARDRQEQVLIWGDFDCDGVTSTALLLTALRSLGLKVDFTIPLRSQEGHGLNRPRLDKVMEGRATLLITVDCGVGNHNEITYAQEQGLDVIVTDHHLLPETLPPALAVINPLRLDPRHPLWVLPGVGVAYKLAEAVFAQLNQSGIPSYLDLATVGIVADVAVLQRECRYLVQRGLPVLAQTSRQGLRLLLETVMEGSLPLALTATDVAFKLAPKLSAIGRLDDAGLAVELLTTSDPRRAAALVEQFLAANEERKALTEQVFSEAQEQVELENLAAQGGIVLAQEGWHAGVLGIAASRLAELYGCPTVLLTIPTQGDVASGSGRSVSGVDLAAALDAVDPLLLGHGGHPMAAGLQVNVKQLAAAQAALTRELGSRLTRGDGTRALGLEIALDPQFYPHLEQALEEIFHQLQILEPFGHGNPRPLIALINLPNIQSRQKGDPPDTLSTSRTGEHLSVNIGSHRLWWWREGERLRDLNHHEALDVAFVLEPTDYQGQVWRGVVKHIKPAGSESLGIPGNNTLKVIDAREQPSLASNQDGDPCFTGSLDPFFLAPQLHLQAWPSTSQVLREILQQVRPQTVILDQGLCPQGIPVQHNLLATLKLWKQHQLDPESLAKGGIPVDLCPLILNHAAISREDTQRIQGWLSIFQEAEAFQTWVKDASLADIEKLLRRLLCLP